MPADSFHLTCCTWVIAEIMNFILFQIRQILTLLADGFLFPFRKLRQLWFDPKNGRAILFGLPALLVALFGVTMALVAMNSHDRFLSNYEVAKDRAEKQENWDEAIIYMRKIMQLRPKDDSAKWELSNLLMKDTREETSDSNKRMALAIKLSLSPTDRPGFPDAQVWRANQLTKLLPNENTTRQAVNQLLNFALESDPRHIDARVMKAEKILIPEGKFDEALDIYEDLFEDYKDYFVKVAELCGQLVMQARRRDDETTAKAYETRAKDCLNLAIKRYTADLENDPTNLSHLRRRANAYAMLRQHEEGEKSLEDAIAASQVPADRAVLEVALSRLYLAHANNLQENGKVLEYLIKALNTDPENATAKMRLAAVGFSKAPEAAEALAAYDPRENPDEAPDVALQLAGTYEFLNGDRLLGIRLLELAVQKNGNNDGALNNLSFAVMESDLDRAADLAERAVRLQSQNPHYRETLAKIYMKQGDWTQATSQLEVAEREVRRFIDTYQEYRVRAKGEPNPEFAQRLQAINRLNLLVHEALVECFQQQGMVTNAANYQKKLDELKTN